MTRCELSWPQKNTKQTEALYRYIKTYFNGDYSMLVFVLLDKTFFDEYYGCFYYSLIFSADCNFIFKHSGLDEPGQANFKD